MLHATWNSVSSTKAISSRTIVDCHKHTYIHISSPFIYNKMDDDDDDDDLIHIPKVASFLQHLTVRRSAYQCCSCFHFWDKQRTPKSPPLQLLQLVNQVSTPLAGSTGWGHVKVSSTGLDLKRALPAEGEHLQRRNGSIRFQGNSGTYLPNYKTSHPTKKNLITQF